MDRKGYQDALIFSFSKTTPEITTDTHRDE